MKRKFICTAPVNCYRKPYCRWANIDDKGWIDGETPIEDFGMFLILDVEISPEPATRIFFALMGKSEGEEPEVVENEEDIDEKRAVILPQQLTKKEYKIYLTLSTE